MRIRVTIDDDVYKTVLDRSRVSGRRFGEVLCELVRRELRKRARFDVPPGAPMISAQRVQDYLDEEGPF